MFENSTPQTPPQNPLNPVMPAPGLSNAQGPAPVAPPPFAPPAPQVHSMPERFRNTGPAAGGPPASSKTKKLVITLIIVAVVAGLGVAGLYIFNTVVKSNANTVNAINTVSNITTSNLNTVNANASTNLNLNATANVNSAVNGNTNTVTNVTSNVNTAVNVNATNTSVNTNTAVTSIPLPANTDTDGDGLTDTEELVFGTEASILDTDGDTFIDGRGLKDGKTIGEVVGLYNPKGAGQIETTTLVKRVQNAAQTYGLLVPAAWTINESTGLLVVTPTTTTGEFFQVRTYDNASRLSAAQWYQSNDSSGQIGLTTSIAVNGLEGLISPDGTAVYLFKEAQVFGLTYTTGSLSKVNFWTTFEMMRNSFKLVATS